MSRTILHRVRLVLIACIAVLAFPTTSLAAPPTFHGTYEGSFETTICGVDGIYYYSGVEVVWDGGDSVKVIRKGADTFTADGGGTVVFRFAGTLNLTFTDNGDGTLTIVENYTGLAGSASGSQGGPVLRDVGIIIFTTVIDIATDKVLDTEITLQRGPHPEADSGFDPDFQCAAFHEALGA